jgi:hypothetical protein
MFLKKCSENEIKEIVVFSMCGDWIHNWTTLIKVLSKSFFLELQLIVSIICIADHCITLINLLY